MAQLAIISDDLTGAADAAVAFAAAGYSARVLLDPSFDADVDVVAVTTESRHLPPAEAAERVQHVARFFNGSPLIYKKIDSTLRGNVAHELLALMDVTGDHKALIAPAFPAQGRVTVSGRQMIGGRPLEETDFAGQVATSSLREIFVRARGTRPVRLLSLIDARSGLDHLTAVIGEYHSGLLIADAENDDDLTAIAEAAIESDLRLLCGSAGLCHALARLDARERAQRPVAGKRSHGPILVIAGSLHAATIAQLDAVRETEIPMIEPDGLDDATIEQVVQQAAEHLHEKHDVIIASHRAGTGLPDDEEIAGKLGFVTRRILEQEKPGGLFLTGGDVASAVCREIDARAIDLFGEVQPGIPYGKLRNGELDGTPVVTKAGGFGGERAIIGAIAWMKR